MSYDSKKDTLEHIRRVQDLLKVAVIDLEYRAKRHDKSKLRSPEKEIFDKYTPLLKKCTYNSEEYKKYLKEMQVALQHHYDCNPHHPEHFENGVDDMTLFDVIEMLLDWQAASERHEDGNIHTSIEANRWRFDINPQLCKILSNTIKYLKTNYVI